MEVRLRVRLDTGSECHVTIKGRVLGLEFASKVVLRRVRGGVPKVIGQREPLRAQLIILSTDAMTYSVRFYATRTIRR